jgi:molybdenum cofactor cytidylyltransferase
LRAGADGHRRAAHRGRRGHGAALSRLSGDTGARVLLQAHRRSLLLLPCDDPGVLQDIDLPEQLPMPAR